MPKGIKRVEEIREELKDKVLPEVETTKDEKFDEEVKYAVEVTSVPTIKEAVQKLVDGKKYVLYHVRGEYKIFEKRSDGEILIQIEQDSGKANKLFNQLEAWARRYRMAETGLVEVTNFHM